MYSLSLRCERTGEVRNIVSDDEWGDLQEYLWTEGNYACDCNRAIFFEEAGDGSEDPDAECGDSAYTAISVTLSDGTVLPVDYIDEQ